MRVLLLLSLVAVAMAGSLAQTPRPCRCPVLLTGSLAVAAQNDGLWAVANYIYDGLGHRFRIQEIGSVDNKTFTFDALLMYDEATTYIIYKEQRKCTKRPLKGGFHPMEVPQDAMLLGQVVLGSSSEPGEGLLVDSWAGEIPTSGKYQVTVSAYGCIPISTTYHDAHFGWMLTSFYNNVKGIVDPGKLNPPDFCREAEFESDQKPGDFYNLFS